jgi:hypothetical protein
MCEIKNVPDANGTGVRVVAAEDGIATEVRSLRQGEAGVGGEGESGGIKCEAAAGEHDVISVASRGLWSTAISSMRKRAGSTV